MALSGKITLFFLRQDLYFPEGTLLELADADMLELPDRGSGQPAAIDRSYFLECPPFAENVPPGQCPVQITSFKFNDIGETSVDQTIHYQNIVIPVRNSAIASISVNDRVRDFEADHYESPSGEPDENYRLPIGHLRPGFYEAAIEVSNAPVAKLTFIKHFPPPFTERYADLAAAEQQRVSESKETTRTEPEPKKKYIDDGSFSDDLLNIALKLATEWGENFRKPINGRILAIQPELTPDEIDRLTAIAREAESYIYRLAERELAGEITEAAIPKLAVKQYAWLNRENVGRLTGIGMYYARK